MSGDHRWKEPAIVVAITGVVVALISVLVATLAFGRDLTDFTLPDRGTESAATSKLPGSPSADTSALASGTPAESLESSKALPNGTKRIRVELSPNDQFPQGAVVVSPPQLGPDYWTGDFSIECFTPDKTRSQQNCTNADERKFIIAPINDAVKIAAVDGDAMNSRELCGEGRGAEYRAIQLTIQQGADYCVLKTAEPEGAIVMRVSRLSIEKPRPTAVLIDVITLSR